MDEKTRAAAAANPLCDVEHSSWIRIFRAFDADHDGLIEVEEMQKAIHEATFSFGFDHYELQTMALLLEMRQKQPIGFVDFCYMMCKCKGYRIRHLLFAAAQSVVPKNRRISVFSRIQRFKCAPPPLFMIIMSLIQVAIYVFYVLDSGEGVWLGGPLPTQSPLILSRFHYSQVWRFLTYAFVQVGIFHAVFNVLVQMLIGMPLELVYHWKTILIYWAGVVCGSLLSVALDGGVFLAGAGGGCFALLASHLITLIVYYDQMDLSIPRIAVVGTLAVADFVVAVFQRHVTHRIDKVSFLGHVGGAVAGILLTFVLLNDRRKHRWQIFTFWASLVAFALFVSICAMLIMAPLFSH